MSAVFPASRNQPVVAPGSAWPAFRRLGGAVLLAGLSVLAGLAAPLQAVEASRPSWPLPLKDHFLTSDFMEYRDGRFHAGLDLKTNGECGFAVLAVEDGWISRLVAGPGGYGRAAYLTTPGGRTYVYAHLERFADRLAAPARLAQWKTGQRYAFDITLPPGRLAVRRQDVLGLSGQSGTNGPHLHFEVRNALQEPLNPLAQGFAVSDTFRPVIRRVRALPAGPTSRLQGGLTACAVFRSGGLSGELPALEVCGPVAFSAEIVDASDIRGHHLEPFRLEVTLDGRPVYEARNDSFAFADNGQMRLEWLELGDIRERWLYRRPQDTLPGRDGGSWSLADSGLATGRHEVTLAAEDYAGNRAEVHWALVVQPTGDAGSPAGSSSVLAAADRWQPACDRISLPPAPGQTAHWLTPFLEGSCGERGTCSLRPATWSDHRGAAEGWDEAGLLTDRGGAGPPLQRHLLGPADSPTLLAETVLWVVPDSLDAGERLRAYQQQGLRALGPCAFFLAADWPAAGTVPMTFAGPATDQEVPNGAGVYRQDDDGKWSWVGELTGASTTDRRAASFALGKPGRHAVMADARPPRFAVACDTLVVGVQARSQVDGVSLPRWQIVELPVQEEGSGVRPATCRASVDGLPLIAEPDLPRQRLLVELPDTLSAGHHALQVTVQDRAGLIASGQFGLLCRP